MILSINFVASKKTIRENYEIVDGDSNHYDVFTDDSTAQVIVSLITVNLWKTRERKRTLENPLLELAYRPEELTTFESVLIKKIVENLRIQYMCHLRIQSVPEGAHIRSINGLEGITPLEWITPLGKLPIIGELEGYEPIQRKIDLNVPGTHTYELQMHRRQFYHSKLFRPTIAIAATSAASFSFCRYFKNKYDRLGKQENKHDVPAFENNYHAAKTFEAVGYSTLALTGASFTLCFFF